MKIVKSPAGVKAESNNVQIPFDKFPSIILNTAKCNELTELIELLNTKKKYLVDMIEKMEDSYAKNEFKIDLINSNILLAKHHTEIAKRKQEADSYIKGVIAPNINAMLNNFDELVDKATAISKDDEAMKSYLDNTNWKLLTENYDFRLDFYISVKKYLDKEQEENKNEQ
jgi:hypothetical protein